MFKKKGEGGGLFIKLFHTYRGAGRIRLNV